jgi:hypothetical protein
MRAWTTKTGHIVLSLHGLKLTLLPSTWKRVINAISPELYYAVMKGTEDGAKTV